jgi:hypothetical protein
MRATATISHRLRATRRRGATSSRSSTA